MLQQVKRRADSDRTDGERPPESETAEETRQGQRRPGTAETDESDLDVNEQLIEAESISYDQLFELLKNKRRRKVLRYLLEVDEEITLDVLAERIAAEENGKDIKQITSQERKRVYVGLYQCHLPKMDDWGAISYNKPRGKISATENTDLFGHYLPDNTDTDDRQWTEYWSGLPLGLMFLFLAAVVLGAVGLISMGQLVVVSFVATFTSVSMLQYSR
jgi:DNA-binding transcriptional ArsR family regulator